IYHNTATNKFDFIIWDVNGTFGANKQMGMNISQLENLSMLFIPSPSSIRPLNDKMLQNATYKNSYVTTVCNYVSNYFSHAYLDPIIDSLANLIRPYVYADTNKFYTNQQFEDNINIDVTTVTSKIPGLKSLITNRRNSLQLQLASFGCYLDINDNSYSDFDMIIYPNPASDQIHVILARNDIPDKLSVALINYTGQLKYTETLMRQNEFNIDISGLPAGIYLLIINNETGRKIVIN
ncbi:MAG: CotH kinase family protein, partial [Bacteroidales bacterium]